jgi:hypothetical protein
MCTTIRRLSISLTFRRVNSVRRAPVPYRVIKMVQIERSRRSIDELGYFFLTENRGQAIALLGIGSIGNALGSLERLDVEEA